MRRSILSAIILSLFLAWGLAVGAQSSKATDAPAEAAVKAGTKIKAQLESTVDARTAKPGDEVAARVTHDVKQKGKTVVRKGDRLLGRVTDVQGSSKADAKAKSGSQVDVVFDRLVQGEATTQLNTVLTAVLSTPAEERARQQEMMQEPPMMAPAPAQGGGSAAAGGGLVGGVASTATSTVGAVGSAAGNVTGDVAGAADSTVNGVGGTLGAATATSAGGQGSAGLATPLRAIHLSTQASAQNQNNASSVLSTRQGNLRLESGTRVEFRVAGSTQAESAQKKQ